MRGLKGFLLLFKKDWKISPLVFFARYAGAIWFLKHQDPANRYFGWFALVLAFLQDINHWAVFQYPDWGGWKEKYGDNPPWDPAQK